MMVNWITIGSLGLTTIILSAIVVMLLSSIDIPSSGAAVALCDQAVAAMLDSHDPVELQRADMLIRHVNCNVRKRLPRD